jgi:NCK-associated protein 1
MAKFAEKLFILREHSEGLLERLYNMKKQVDDPSRRPAVLNAPNMTRLFSALERNAPKFGDDIERVCVFSYEILTHLLIIIVQVQGYDYVKQNLSVMLEDIQPIYNIFRAILDWITHAQLTLEEMATSSSLDFDHEVNLLTMTDYFTVLTNYIKMILLLNRVDQKMLLLCLYNLVYFKVNGTNEHNVQKVHQMFKEFRDPFEMFREKLFPVTNHAGKALMNLLPAFEKGHTPYLTNKRPLELLSEPDRIPYPAVEDTYIHLTLYEQMNEWIAYVYACCPEALGMAPNQPAFTKQTQTKESSGLFAKFKKAEVKEVRTYELLLTKVLESSYMLRLYGDEAIPIHEPYDQIVKTIKTPTINLKKEKTSLATIEENAAANAQEHHMNRRLYLLLQLRALLNMMKDSPGLLGPKFQLVLAVLSLSKMEILWYFRHVGVRPKFSPKNFRDVKDTNIAEMIYLIDELMSVCLQHRDVISVYHANILKKLYHKKITDIVEFNKIRFEGQLMQVMQSILNDMTGASPDYQAMRMNWKRMEAFLSGYQFKNALNEHSIKELFSTMAKVCIFSRHVDEVEQELAELVSLKELYFYQKQVYELFKSGLDGDLKQPLYSISFLRILDYYPDNIHKTLNPELRKQVGQQAVELAAEMLEVFAQRIETKLDEFRGPKGHGVLYKQMGGIEVAERFKYMMLKDQYKDKERLKDIDKKPGFESYHRENNVIKEFRAIEKNFTQLLFSLGRYEEIVVFDTVYYPTEYLRSRLETYIDNYVASVALRVTANAKETKNDAKLAEFPAPSLVLYELQTFMISLRVIEQCINVKAEDLLMNAFLKHFVNLKYIESPFKADKQKQLADNVIITYARWYADLIANATPKYKLFYSPVRKSFISTAATPISAFNAEEYVDYSELHALASLVGPYGIRVIDQHLLDEVYTLSEQLRDVLSQHHKDLKDVETQLFTDIGVKGIERKFKGLDALMNLAIQIGGILVFRKNLQGALEDVVRQNVPIIYNVVHAAYKQYPENVFVDKKFLPVDEMATDCGIQAYNADSALKLKLAQLAENSSVWEIIPVAFSVLLTSPQLWKDNDFNIDLEGWTNNTHLAIDCFNQLVVAIYTVKSSEQGACEAIFERFANCAAMLLLNMKSQKAFEKQVDSCYVFADKLIQESPFLKSSIFEEMTPYALLRSIYRETYDIPTQV